MHDQGNTRFQWFEAPVISDDDESRQQYMTKTILTMMGVALGIFTVPVLIGTAVGYWDLESVVIIALVDLFVGVGWWLSRRGRWRLGSYVAPMVMFALGLYGTCWIGLSTMFVLFYAIAILLVSMLRGGKATWFALVFSVLTHIGIASFRDPRSADSVASALVTFSGALLGVALLQRLFTTQLQRALAQARESAAGLRAEIEERKRAEESLRRYADENARLLETERQQRELAETLREVGATLAATLDADIVLDRLLEQVGRVVPHDVANVMIIEGDNVRVVRSRGYEKFGIDISAAYAPHPFTDVHNLVAMAETGEPIVVSDVSADPSWIRRSELTWRRSYVGVPIRARGKAIGFLNISDSRAGYYTSEHAERLRAFADQAAIALENARLYATEQRRSAELARALERQRELERLQREFIQNVSHELRTPLALIRGHAEVLENGWLGELAPEQKESIGVITRRAQMLGRLVEDIVGILEVERRELKREAVDLAQLVRTAVADFQPAAQKAELTLRAEVASEVCTVLGDGMALRRVLDNLVGNAFKFTSAGGRVTVQLSQDERAVVLQVADTGIGIPGDQMGRVFERFYQVDGSSTRKYGGMGLGLALVKSIVEAHDGQITATSQVGVGTMFTVLLPPCL